MFPRAGPGAMVRGTKNRNKMKHTFHVRTATATLSDSKKPCQFVLSLRRINLQSSFSNCFALLLRNALSKLVTFVWGALRNATP